VYQVGKRKRADTDRCVVWRAGMCAKQTTKTVQCKMRAGVGEGTAGGVVVWAVVQGGGRACCGQGPRVPKRQMENGRALCCGAAFSQNANKVRRQQAFSVANNGRCTYGRLCVSVRGRRRVAALHRLG